MMKLRKMAALRWATGPVAAAVLLTACTTATPYQPRMRGTQVSGGYSEQRIEDNRYRVTFVGNSLTSRDRVENYLLYRAAELTRQAGYDCFTMMNRDTDERTRYTGYRPFRSGPWGYWGPSWRYRHHGFWHAWDPWGYDPFWADDIDIRAVTSYEAFAEIVMSRGACPSDPRAFTANDVLRNLGPTIRLPERS